jgi:flavin reductase (DIM6/NTAB) family NADH-FMN oxidoreductase RutF
MARRVRGPSVAGRDAAVDPVAFRRWMGQWATGVTVVTAADGDHDFGMTVNAFLSVTLRPPTVLVSLGEDAEATPIVERTQAFAVNLLSATQRALSERFAQTAGGDEKFRGIPIHRSPRGLPLLDGTLGALECEVTDTTPVADHHLILGQVVAVHAGPEEVPLVFFHSGYAERDDDRALRLPGPRR